jgi:hypothetical protein
METLFIFCCSSRSCTLEKNHVLVILLELIILISAMCLQVVVPVPHLRSVTPTASQQNPAERYIQVVSVDNHEFWFMGFVNYDSAVKYLQEAARGSA